MYKKFFDLLNEFENITIFRHVRPDGDAMFSSLALYEFIKTNFKTKKVKLCGKDTYDLISRNDSATDSFIAKSLAIVLDTSNADRIDDYRCLAANKIVKIDHHPAIDDFGDLNIVKPTYSSASELLADILLSNQFSKYTISKLVYKYLYCGIITDTLNLRTSNTSSHTLSICSKLILEGDLNPSDIYSYLFDINLDTFNKVSLIRSKLKVTNNFGYIKLSKTDLKKIKISALDAKNHIDIIGNVSEFNVWAIAVENDSAWDCSIRSKRKYIVNEIAIKYGGGGHPNACAVKQVTSQNLDKLFKDLSSKSRM